MKFNPQWVNPIFLAAGFIKAVIIAPLKAMFWPDVPVVQEPTTLQLLEQQITITRKDRLHKSAEIELSELNTELRRVEREAMDKRVERLSQDLQDEADAIARVREQVAAANNVVALPTKEAAAQG